MTTTTTTNTPAMYQFHQAAGGQGTTTCAVGVALLHADQGRKVLFLSDKIGKVEEIGASRWMGTPGSNQQTARVTFVNSLGGGSLVAAAGVPVLAADRYEEYKTLYDVIVTDGTVVTDGYRLAMGNDRRARKNVWCVMGPGYSELSKLHRRLEEGGGRHADYVLVTSQPDRSLGVKDVTATLGARVGEVVGLPWEPAVFRNMDAGLVEKLTRTQWGRVLGQTFAWQDMKVPG